MNGTSLESAGRLRVVVIGAGKVGRVFASALRALGHQILGVSARTDAHHEEIAAMLPAVPIVSADGLVSGPDGLVSGPGGLVSGPGGLVGGSDGAGELAGLVGECDLVVIATPDAVIASVCEQVATQIGFRPGQLVMHLSGALGLGALQAASAQGAIPLALHPAMTFTGTSADLPRLQGCHWAITAPAPFLPIGQALVVELGGEGHVLAENARPLYHAALSHGANHMVTLVTQALRALREAGISEPGVFAAPLLYAALERALAQGEAGLTGPIVRGDEVTVRAHVAALEAATRRDPADADPTRPFDDLGDVPQLYRVAGGITAGRAQARGVLTPDQAAKIQAALDAST